MKKNVFCEHDITAGSSLTLSQLAVRKGRWSRQTSMLTSRRAVDVDLNH